VEFIWRGHRLVWIVIASGGVVVFIFGLLSGLSLSRGHQSQPSSVELQSVNICMDDAIKQLKRDSVDIALLRDVNSYCYSKISSQGYINELQIRRSAFTQQGSANVIIMWMVVSITLAGVILAGVQLLASYRISTNNNNDIDQAGELSIARDRVVLKSSIVGLFILVISFAFFMVFILYVYRLDKSASGGSGEPHIEQLEPGGLGNSPPN
jgi:hypothetical protein